MGNTSSYTSLTTLPSNDWNNIRYKELGIIVDEPKKKESGNCYVTTSAKFPDGWKIRHEGDYHTYYYDPSGYLRFTTSYKDSDYDCWAHVSFKSNEESERILNQDLEKEKFAIEKRLFFSNLPQTLDSINQYVVFEYVEANMYELRQGGYQDHKDEFDRRKLLFTTHSIENAKSIVQEIYAKNYSKQNIAIRHAPNGLENLTRFEIRHLFGEKYDPCLTTGSYSNSHHPNRSTHYEVIHPSHNILSTY